MELASISVNDDSRCFLKSMPKNDEWMSRRLSEMAIESFGGTFPFLAIFCFNKLLKVATLCCQTKYAKNGN